MAFVLTLAFVNGCATVISKMINYRCTKYLGTNNGSLVNYIVASVLSFILLLVSSRFSVNLYSFSQAPWWAYLGGAFGIVAFIISMITLSHLKVMESTILLLVGQIIPAATRTIPRSFLRLIFWNISASKRMPAVN